jgi:hypothetical protein
MFQNGGDQLYQRLSRRDRSHLSVIRTVPRIYTWRLSRRDTSYLSVMHATNTKNFIFLFLLLSSHHYLLYRRILSTFFNCSVSTRLTSVCVPETLDTTRDRTTNKHFIHNTNHMTQTITPQKALAQKHFGPSPYLAHSPRAIISPLQDYILKAVELNVFQNIFHHFQTRLDRTVTTETACGIK